MTAPDEGKGISVSREGGLRLDWLRWIEDGGVTSPAGWQAGAAYAGVKTYGEEPRLDVGILASQRPCVAAGVFTRNLVTGPAVRLDRLRLENAVAQAIVVNSGCSNTVTGEQGEIDAVRMAAVAAERIGITEDDMLVASTGVIGRLLPMGRIEPAIASIELAPNGGLDFARAIMTTDTRPKQRAARFEVDGRTYTVGGVAKGSGMVHPDMATVFCFLTTDAPVEPRWLRETLWAVADNSINMIDVDMDTSTSDTMLLLANGAAGGDRVSTGHEAAERLRVAIEAVAVALARDLAGDGEGATTLIEVVIEGAATRLDARLAARTVASSPLVKTMVTGHDPNLGRVMAAVGRSGARVDVALTSVWIGQHCAFEQGAPTEVDYGEISRAMEASEVRIRVDLGLGDASATAWGCDLTEDYVRINSEYTT